MARTHGPADALEELDSLADRMTGWVAANRVLAITAAAAVLLSAAGMGAYLSWRHEREQRASDAVSAVREEFVRAMGGTPGSFEVPEPANPETAREVRERFAKRFREVATEKSGTTAAVEAHLEAGALLEQLGRPEEALEVWQQGLAATPGDSPLRGLVLERIAGAHESAGRFPEAAEAHQAAAALQAFPLRDLALADAARCWAEAGQPDRALDAWEQLRARDAQASAPPHVRARLDELAARRAAAP